MIYLDSAATTLEKPASVRRAVSQAIDLMSSPGRGGYSAARLAEETAFQCRTEAAKLFHVPTPEQVIFTHNATHGLNIAIKSLVHPVSRVVISGYEHNAVTRPLHAIPNVERLVIDTPLFSPDQALEELQQALKGHADAVIWNHVSNVFGYRQPIEKIAKLCREKNIPLIIDASQSAGVIPIDMKSLDAAFIAMPGHKGLYGPQGTGLLLCGEVLAEPLIEGGTGSFSKLQRMPPDLPDRLEAGTHNMPGIAGLLEGLRFVRSIGETEIASHERALIRYAAEQMRKIPRIKIFQSKDADWQTGVLSFIIEEMDSQEAGDRLAGRGIAVRAGLHCAPLAHRTAGTLDTGTIRLSPSAFTARTQIDRFLTELSDILS